MNTALLKSRSVTFPSDFCDLDTLLPALDSLRKLRLSIVLAIVSCGLGHHNPIQHHLKPMVDNKRKTAEGTRYEDEDDRQRDWVQGIHMKFELVHADNEDGV